MERVRARCCLAVGAIALAMSATAVGAVAAPPRDLTADLAPVAARVPMPHTLGSDSGRGGARRSHPASERGPRHGRGPARDGPRAVGRPAWRDGGSDARRGDGLRGPDGHGRSRGRVVAVDRPGSWPRRRAEPRDEPALPTPTATGRCRTWTTRRWRATSRRTTATTRRTTPRSATRTPPAATTTRTPQPRATPRGVVLGGFVAINGLVLGAAALTRRRDRAAAALKARRTSTTSKPEKDASR